MFAVPVQSFDAKSQANIYQASTSIPMEQTKEFNNVFSWLLQIKAELRALRTWFQNMENRPIVQMGMQTLQDLDARVSRLEAPAQSTEVLQQILQRLDLILDLVQNLDSNALGWPTLQCQPSTGGLANGAINRLPEEVNNPGKTDQHFCNINGTNIIGNSAVTVTDGEQKGSHFFRDNLILLFADLKAAVTTMEQLGNHELPASGPESIPVFSQARLDPKTPPFEPSTANQPAKEASSPTRHSAHGPDQGYRPLTAVARLEALGHPLEQSIHAPKRLVSTTSPLHAARTSNGTLKDEPCPSFLEKLQKCGIKFSQPQLAVPSRDHGDNEDNALGKSDQTLHSPTRHERGLSSGVNLGRDHDNFLPLKDLQIVKQRLEGNTMKENNPPKARKIQEPFEAEGAQLSNKANPAPHPSSYNSPSTVLKMINSDFFTKNQKSYAIKSPPKHEPTSIQVGSLSSPKPVPFKNTSFSDVNDPFISARSGEKVEFTSRSDTAAAFASHFDLLAACPNDKSSSATSTSDPFEQQSNSLQTRIDPSSRPGTNQSSPQRQAPNQAILDATALPALMNEGFKNFLQKADYHETDPRKKMVAVITSSTAKRRQEIARIFAEDGQFISSTAPAPKHPRIAGELLDEEEKAMVMRPPTSIPAKRQGWDWIAAKKQDGTKVYRLHSSM
ncbi:MAG: hypothetical protein Q9167_001001 [Letrouitia subvulpina]